MRASPGWTTSAMKVRTRARMASSSGEREKSMLTRATVASDVVAVVMLLGGLVALLVGSELLVRGAVGLAIRLGLSTVVIGLTVVSLGTGSPEFAVAARSGVTGTGELALGNVLGSNVANVLLVLGTAAVVSAAAIGVTERIVRTDVPVMVAVTLLASASMLDGTVGRVEGGVLLALLGVYLVWNVLAARRGPIVHPEEFDEATESARDDTAVRSVVLLVGGVALLVLGARWLVDGAGDVARGLGVPEFVIGLTVVAVGTSAPELAASITASRRGETDLAVANVVGSNVVNLLGVLGLAALVSADGIPVAPAVVRIDLPVLVASAVVCLLVLVRTFRITRGQGAMLLGLYVAYLVVVATVGAG